MTVWVPRAVLATAVLAFGVAILVRGPDRQQVPAVDIVLYSAVYLLAALLLLLQRAPDRHERWAWRSLGLGMFATLGGDLYYSLVLVSLAEPPYPSVADGLYLMWYPAAYVAVLLLIRSRVPRFHPSTVMDGLVAGLGAAAVVAAFVVQDLVELTGGSTMAVVVTLAYPVADLLLVLVLAAGGAVVGRHLSLSTAGVVVGLVLTTSADVAYMLGTAAGSYVEGGVVDLLWLLGVLAMVVAAGLRPPRPPSDDDRARLDTPSARRRTDRRLVTLPLLSGAASLGCIGLAQFSPVPMTALVLADACIITAMVRGWLTLRDLRRREEQELVDAYRLARTDELTGLVNRRGLLERCDEALATASLDAPLAVMLLDLDRFKEINDSLGHGGGDALLHQVAGRLLDLVRPQDVVARLGGDEFAVLMPATDSGAALAAGRGVRAALAPPFVVDGIRLHVDASIGVATAPAPAASRGDLLRLADMAMYDAKRSHVGVATARDRSEEATPERLRTVDELRSALAGHNPGRAGTLVVHLQPQVRLGHVPGGGQTYGDVVGVEALVRWDHPVRGLLLPGAFLPLAESAGLTGALAEQVLDLALTACGRWWRQGFVVPVSVNLSAADLSAAAMPDLIGAMLRRHRLPGRALVVELTEDTMMADPAAARDALHRIRALGVGVSIDDYGTGYSSLAYLRDLSADELKLDRAFTADLLSSAATASIVRSTVDLAHSLGLRLVAEGIEDADVARALAALGCDIGQGHHIARPMPTAEMLPWLTAHAGGPSPAPATARAASSTGGALSRP